MSKTTIAIVLISMVILAGGVVLLTRKDVNNQITNPVNTTNSSTQHRYFWSKTCPHCTNVAEFMDTWEGKDAFEMEKYEVNESEENRKLLIVSGTKICGKPTNKIGVPLLVTPKGECFMGDVPIIEYLKEIQ